MDSRKILVVDDDITSSNALSLRLIKRGYEVLTHGVGLGTIELIEAQKVDVVLLDIMLPDVSGLEVLAQIRRVYKSFELPVIMVTSKDQPHDVTEALQAGASDYLAKPLNMDVATARINTQLRLVDLYRESIVYQQIVAINAMIVTYNHEINNPLAVAIGNLDLAMMNSDHPSLKKVETALRRISDIVKKINDVTAGNLELTDYTTHTKMVKL